uniref:Uncharacterized protein n=1 Tax=Timema monikensis TaxID=170555 RepID=A0A7R9EBV5_9NEOP|nr:unnamed protein product [Timema monikensis]
MYLAEYNSLCTKTVMGKLKRPRQKYHFSKIKSPEGETPLDTPLLAESNLPLELPSGNIFSGVKITLEHLKQKLPDDDVTSVVSSRKSKLDNSSKPTTKKEKIKNRKEAFLRRENRSCRRNIYAAYSMSADRSCSPSSSRTGLQVTIA